MQKTDSPRVIFDANFSIGNLFASLASHAKQVTALWNDLYYAFDPNGRTEFVFEEMVNQSIKKRG